MKKIKFSLRFLPFQLKYFASFWQINGGVVKIKTIINSSRWVRFLFDYQFWKKEKKLMKIESWRGFFFNACKWTIYFQTDPPPSRHPIRILCLKLGFVNRFWKTQKFIWEFRSASLHCFRKIYPQSISWGYITL